MPPDDRHLGRLPTPVGVMIKNYDDSSKENPETGPAGDMLEGLRAVGHEKERREDSAKLHPG